jgi:uncharacterized membrane protein
MQISGSRLSALTGIGLIVFAISAFLLVQVMPSPMRPFDYLICGAVSTLICLLVLWVLLMRETGQEKDLLFKKRAKQKDGSSGNTNGKVS